MKLLIIAVAFLLLAACGGSSEELPGTAPTVITPAKPLTQRASGRSMATSTAPAAPSVPLTITPLPTSAPPSPTPAPPQATATALPRALTFAVIGDYGANSAGSAEVAALVNDWNPDLVLTVGDNNYPDGAAGTITNNISQHYGRFIADDRFFPTLGNHDVTTDFGRPYLDYFQLPGNERYYEFVRGDVHFFALNSDWREVDGIGAGSRQAAWLQEVLATSNAPWQVVYFHAPPYVSMQAKEVPAMRWPFRMWGADLVIAGHAHLYERLRVDELPYLVVGLGGGGIYAFDDEPLPQSETRFNADYGALRVEATASQLTAQFITRQGLVIDQLTLSRPD